MGTGSDIGSEDVSKAGVVEVTSVGDSRRTSEGFKEGMGEASLVEASGVVLE